MSSGRVLIVGGKAGALAERLGARGYVCDSAPRVTAELEARPDVVVLTGTARSATTALKAIRENPELRSVPVLIDGSAGGASAYRQLDVEGVAQSLDELERHLAASVRARRLTEREELVRRRLELLLEISRATATHGVVELIPTVTSRLRDALGAEKALALRLEGAGPRKAWLVDEATRTPVELAVSPTLRRALESGEPTAAEGTWVHPLKGEAEGIAALVIKRRAPLEQEERDFLSAVSLALSRAAEQARVQVSEERTRESLEAAYLERYRELLEANERLKALDRKKNELLAVLSHDLRAPLNVLIGHAHLLLSDPSLPPPLRPSGEAMQRTGKKILELVESLLEKSRTEEGRRIVLFTTTMDVSETCQEAVHDLQILAKERGLKLRVEAPLSLMVLGDEQKIRQVLQNLITNALTHAAGATNVVVRARLKQRPDGDVALVEVQDDGKLADPNELLLAFEKSKGLGLAISREYVERHGGEIWAEVSKEGGGVFAFTLPIKLEKPKPPAAQRADVPLVLLAESDPVFARVSSMGLSGHYRVELARDGNEVVAKARALLPDVIVMSVFMPSRDGLDALRELKATPEIAHIPVVLVSAHADLSGRIRTLDVGAVDLLTKPFPLSTLLTRVSEVLQRTTPARTAASPGTDPDTGLADQLGVVNRLAQEISRSVRYGRPLTLAVLKPTMPPTNIRVLAAVVRRELRVPDMVGHLGGGVLAVLLPETPSEASRPLISRLCKLLEDAGVSYRPRLVDVRDGAQGAEAVLEEALA